MIKFKLAIAALAIAVIAAPITFERNASVTISSADAKQRPKRADKRSRKQKKIDRHLSTAQYFLVHERDSKAAAREFARVLKLDNGNLTAGIGLALIHLDNKKTARAVKVLTRLAKKKPREVRVWHALGRAHIVSGNTAKALGAYRSAIKVSRTDRESLFQVFTLLDVQFRANAATRDELRDAAMAFIKVEHNRQSYRYRQIERRIVAISGEPVDLIVYDANRAYQAAFTERRMGQINAKMAEARRGFAKCLEKQPKNQRCHYGLGLVYSSVKASKFYNRKKARAEFAKASALADAHFELGRLARYEDNFKSARASFRKAIELRANYPHAHLELGIVHKLEGNDRKAIANFTRAYKADRHSAVAEKAVTELAKIEPDHEIVRAGMLFGGMTGDVFSTDRFRAAVTYIESRYGGVDAEAKEKPVLETVLARILGAADVDSTTPIKVAVLKTPVVNAMAMPNGNVYFTRGFLDLLKTKWPKQKVDANNDTLAHVMAHEVAHILRKHTLNSLLFRQAYKDAGSRLDGAVLTHVTRLQEIEADRVGMVLASLAGYHPRGGIEFMEHQGQAEEIPQHLDHPTYEERARYLEDYWTNEVKYAYLSFELGNRAMESGDKSLQLAPDKARKYYSASIDHFQRFRATLKPTKRVLNNLGIAYAKRGMLSYAGNGSPLERWQSQFSVEKQSALKYRSVQRKRKESAQTRGSAKTRVPRDLTRALKLFSDALKRDPHYVTAIANKATTEIAIGKLGSAEKTLRLTKSKSPTLSLARGVVLAERKRYAKAATAFAIASKQRSTRRQAVYNMARAFMLAKESKMAKETFQRYLRKYPKGPWAAAAKKALRSLR